MAINGLSVVGFVVLVAAGIWSATYSTRFVPEVVGRMGSAAVYLGSVFIPAEPTLSVVSTPTATTSTLLGTTTTSENTSPVVVPVPVIPVAGEQTSGAYEIGTTTTALVQSGLPDLIVTINEIGYLATTSANSFIASTTVPAGSRPAVTFSIKNIGTNATGSWRWSASIPPTSNFIYQSDPQQNLNPGDYIDYAFGFDQAIPGVDKMISITANINYVNPVTNTITPAVPESKKDNNSASAKLTIIGG
mgnify:CR=1 FL=1